MDGTKIGIGIFLRESDSIKDLDNHADKVWNKLNSEGLRTFSHSKGSNYIYLQLFNKIDLAEKIKKIDKLEEIENFIMWSDPKQEILDAISDHDYFKAFALCSSAYEYLGKRILINHIDEYKLPIRNKEIKGLQLDDVFNKLLNYKLIDKRLKSEMTEVNKIRINFIHHGLFQTIGKEDFQKVIENIPKLERSINELEKIFEWSEKTH